MIKSLPRPARQRRAQLTTFAAAVVAALALAPVAGATYPGRNGSIAYPESFNNGSVETESVISSIPNASAVNCQGTSSDGSTNCDIGRFGYSPNGKQIVAARSGQLAVLGSDGGNVQLLNALTSDDEQPAFLRGGRTIVFAGQAAVTRTSTRSPATAPACSS